MISKRPWLLACLFFGPVLFLVGSVVPMKATTTHFFYEFNEGEASIDWHPRCTHQAEFLLLRKQQPVTVTTTYGKSFVLPRRIDYLPSPRFLADRQMRGGLSEFYISIPHWLPTIIGWVVFAYYWHKAHEIADGHCKGCGYDLTGNESGRCPECNTIVAKQHDATV